jgi:hypothetical protein
LIGQFYTAARTLKTLDSHRTNVVDHEREIAEVKRRIEAVRTHDVDGGYQPVDGSPSIADLQVQVHHYLAGRGRVWYRATPQLPVSDTGVVAVDMPADQHQIQQGAILFAFDELETAAGGKYMGEFRVTALEGERRITLTSSDPLTARRRANWAAAAPGATWTLYEVLPADSHAVIAALSDDERRTLMPRPQAAPGEDPAALARREQAHNVRVEQYLKDSKPPQEGDLQTFPERVTTLVKFIKQDQAAIETLKGLALAGQPLGIPEGVLSTGETYEYPLPVAELLTRAGIAEEVQGERRYRRRLWDFAVYFHDYNRDLPLLNDRIAATQKGLELQLAANKDALAQLTFQVDQIKRFDPGELPRITAEVEQLANVQALRAQETRVGSDAGLVIRPGEAGVVGELPRLKDERALAIARRDRLQKELDQVQAAITKTLASSRQLADRLAAQQREAAERAEAALNAAQASTND